MQASFFGILAIQFFFLGSGCGGGTPAAPDAEPSTERTSFVTVRGIEGSTVFSSHLDGSVFDQRNIGPSGEVTMAVEEGGMLTVVEFDAALLTYTGVSNGQLIDASRPAEGPVSMSVGRIQVEAESAAGARFYQYFACQDTTLGFDDAQPIADLRVSADCLDEEGAVDVVGVARASFEGPLLAYSISEKVVLPELGEVTIGMQPWLSDFDAYTLSSIVWPLDASPYASAELQIGDARYRVADVPADTGQLQVIPGSSAPLRIALTAYDATFDSRHLVAAEHQDVSLDDWMSPLVVEDARFEVTGRHELRWSPELEADGFALRLAWLSEERGFAAWDVILGPDSGGFLFPEIPEALNQISAPSSPSDLYLSSLTAIDFSDFDGLHELRERGAERFLVAAEGTRADGFWANGGRLRMSSASLNF